MRVGILSVLFVSTVIRSATIQIEKVALGDMHIFGYEETLGKSFEMNKFVRFFPSDGQNTKVYVESTPTQQIVLNPGLACVDVVMAQANNWILSCVNKDNYMSQKKEKHYSLLAVGINEKNQVSTTSFASTRTFSEIMYYKGTPLLLVKKYEGEGPITSLDEALISTHQFKTAHAVD